MTQSTTPYLIGGVTPATTQFVPIGTGTTPQPYSVQTTTLDGVPYLLNFQYNQREDCWYLLLQTVDGQNIYGYVKLVVGWNLLGQCADNRKPAGDLVVITTTQDDSPPGFNDLLPGGRCQLQYLTASDLSALAALNVQQVTAYPALGEQAPPGGGAAPLVLNGAQCLVPGTSVRTSGSNGPLTLNCATTTTTTLTLIGDPTYTYSVLLRVRGIVQQSTPAGSTVATLATGLNAAFCVVTTGGSASNAFTLAISSPAVTYMLNAGTTSAGNTEVSEVDYQLTIAVNGGAMVTITAATIGYETANQTDGLGGLPLTIPGVNLASQPYNGQFVQLSTGVIR